MNSRNLLRLLALAPCLAFTIQAQEQGASEAQVTHNPGDTITTPVHSSRWEYPKSFEIPKGCTVHFVVPGDTLWDLGGRYLGNPYAWPQIWELNKWIKDPHWIFPGDPLLIPDNSALANASEPPVNTAPPQVENLEPAVDSGFKRNVLREMAFTFQDFLQMPYVVSEGAEAYFKASGATTIVGLENTDRINFMAGEKIFLDGGQQAGLKVGDRKVIAMVSKPRLFHPDDRRQKVPLGDVVKQIGLAEINQVSEKSAIATVLYSLDGVQRGHKLLPFTEPANIPMALRDDISDPITPSDTLGKVVYIGSGLENVANGAQVIVDKGSEHGLKVGDILIATAKDTWTVRDDANRKDVGQTTHHYLGQLMVVKTEGKTATCRILRAKDTIQVGTLIFK